MNATHPLPTLVPKDWMPSKVESITTMFPVIPPQERSCYPGGAAYIAANQSKTSNPSADEEELNQDESSPRLPVVKKSKK